MTSKNEDGYELWLRYRLIEHTERLAQYCHAISNVMLVGNSATSAIIRSELARALPALLGCAVEIQSINPPVSDLSGRVLIGTLGELNALGYPLDNSIWSALGEEGFLLRCDRHVSDSSTGQIILITGKTDPAVLRGVFHFLRLLQTAQDIQALDILSAPRIRCRLLSHWDNLDSSIERGYAGSSLWQWDDLPHKISPACLSRYHDYARACASIGINGACLNNVNAHERYLTSDYLVKIAALADIFRPYGIRVYLAPVLTAPTLLKELGTSDPRDPGVADWWQKKVDEIYSLIPDFGGFQIKASSEGQPGPQDYGADHSDGANMLAKALSTHGGILLWRAFVYDTSIDADRAKCAYKEFLPLDKKFLPNVFVQVKNGPIDFQPREPFHPLLGAMRQTPLALELQITQEYLGQSSHLVYLASMWQEILEADTYCDGPGSTVAKVIDGSLFGHSNSVLIGVANTGFDRNWCGHHFAQANWYAFGRLAWDHGLSAETIADEWCRMTWSNDQTVLPALKTMMLGSWEASIDYMTPLGLHHLVNEGHHYGPDPAFNGAKRMDWNNVYFHRADAYGLGFDRTSRGSNAVSQYYSPLREQFDALETCPEKYLLWFHHVPWNHQLSSGKTLWNELQYRYQAGVSFVENMLAIWKGLEYLIDPERHQHVSHRLESQRENAHLWRDVCLRYFGGYV